MPGAASREGFAVWRTRLRWRLSGAWLWPAFCVFVVADAALLARLPFSGGRSSLLGSLLAAGFLNVLIVATVPRLGGWAVRRFRPALPREIAADRAGAIGLVGLFAVLLAGGLAHRSTLQRADAARDRAVSEARMFAAHRAPARYLPLHGEDTWSPGRDVFRTCWAGPDARRDYCVFVRMDEAVPIVRADPDQRPNATVAGADNPGRQDR
jgi:hypothetical protein